MSAAPEPTATLEIALAHAVPAARRAIRRWPPSRPRKSCASCPAIRPRCWCSALRAAPAAMPLARSTILEPLAAGATRLGAHATRTRHRAGPHRPRRRGAGGAAARGRAEARPAAGLARARRPPDRDRRQRRRRRRLRQHIRYSSRDPALLRAGAALAENRIPEAEALLRAHLRSAPNRRRRDPHARRARRAPRPQRATPRHLLARCLELAPGFHAARQNYALVLHRGNKPERGAGRDRHAARASTRDNPGYRNLQGRRSCAASATTTPAIELYDGILRAVPAPDPKSG